MAVHLEARMIGGRAPDGSFARGALLLGAESAPGARHLRRRDHRRQ
jgi:hypothetical protein